MTALETRLQDDQKAAMKAGDKIRLGTIRLVRSQLQYAKLQAREKWSDDAALEVLLTAAKMRREAIEQFEKGNRADLVAKEREELRVIEGYMPRQMTLEELDALIGETIAAMGASSPRDVGKVTGALMSKVKGRADGKFVNAGVREKLGAG